ncbi:MAG: DUF1127 domain-containing protein [Litoreibacter sp.]
MAILDTSRTLTNGAQSNSFFASVVASIMTWNDRRVTRNALAGLTARELDDIGLTRGDVDKL